MKLNPMPDNQQVPAINLVDGQGRVLAPGSVFDSTGVYSFDIASLPKAYTYDGSNNLATITYGPDANGRKIILTKTWNGALLASESAYVLTGTAANVLTLTGANTAVIGNPSGDITVTVGPAGSYFSPFTFTPSDGGGGGKFAPSSVTLSYAKRSATFKYTAASEGVKSLSGSVDQGGPAVSAPFALTASLPGKATAPASVVATVDGTSVTLTWQSVADSSSGGSPIRGYVAKLSNGVGKEIPANSTSWTFRDLAPNVAVTGSVAAITDAGLGGLATSDAVTPIGGGQYPTVPGKPAKPVLTALAGAVSLAWTPGAPGSTPTTGNVWLDINGKTTQLTTNPQVITGIAPGVPYTGTVKTQNAQGFGPASAQADAVTPTAATTFDSVARAGSIISANMAAATVASTFCLQREVATPFDFPWDEVACQLRTVGDVATPIRVSFSPTAQNTKTLPVDAAGAALVPQLFTWGGSTAGTTTSGGAGTPGQTDFIESRSPESDFMSAAAFKAIARTDIVGAPLLVQVRVQGLPSYFSGAEVTSSNANPMTLTEPGFFAGNRSGDYLTTPNASMITMPEANGFTVAIDLIFKYKGRVSRVEAWAWCGDSIDRGWVAASTSPKYGGNINGWMVRAVKAFNAAGRPALLTPYPVAGNKAMMSMNRLYSALLAGGKGISHAVIKPWSTNDFPDGVAGATACQALADKIEVLCAQLGIPLIFQRNHAGQSNTSAACIQVQAYLDAKAAAGKLVWDPRPVMNVAGSEINLKPEFITKDASGNPVDNTHLPEAGEIAMWQSFNDFCNANAAALGRA